MHAPQQTLCKVLDVLLREWLEPILLEKVEDAHPVQLGHQAGVTPEVKVLFEMDTFAMFGQPGPLLPQSRQLDSLVIPRIMLS